MRIYRLSPSSLETFNEEPNGSNMRSSCHAGMGSSIPGDSSNHASTVCGTGMLAESLCQREPSMSALPATAAETHVGSPTCDTQKTIAHLRAHTRK
ncbi:hypothetical protein NliqN6_2703 [Naganishia liquefaciens]|uniref:Uncharacterized protein n=1 Tax=Naganishia liquefaciens TaxID=104408 RepID=A0A8H3TSR7_9TREE|nr:hypothetical protein NliqN6_2703 [Naganishia liquefaciens]